jgi:hypothetical protein
MQSLFKFKHLIMQIYLQILIKAICEYMQGFVNAEWVRDLNCRNLQVVMFLCVYVFMCLSWMRFYVFVLLFSLVDWILKCILLGISCYITWIWVHPLQYWLLIAHRLEHFVGHIMLCPMHVGLVSSLLSYGCIQV